ncbi:MAG: cofactor-independent phosphoglycerate mutase, partial [Verrucomicrobiae bacterium]|nr:cofactor-independent phosphoglycerate mutase [Verrucomicrobiae bacterium]
CCGMLETVPEGVMPGSEAANLSVMGYNPAEILQGRGVLEAASMGLKIEEGELVMRCNLICLDEEQRLKNHSAGHISSEEAATIIHDLQKEFGNEQFSFHPGVSYRHVFIAKGLDARIKCAPPHDYLGEFAKKLQITALCEESKKTAEILNRLTIQTQHWLPEHPVNRRRVAAGKDCANSIWLWSGGYKPKMWTFQEHFGLNGAVISAVDLIRGIGVYAGLKVIPVKGATGLYDTNYEGKAAACLDALKDNDFVYLHVEAPDEAGHEGDAALKIQTIEDLDSRLIAPLLKGLRETQTEAVIGLLPDHPTPVSTRAHTRESIPFAIWGPGFEPDSVNAYSETLCSKGRYDLLKGDQFIKLLLDKTN